MDTTTKIMHLKRKIRYKIKAIAKIGYHIDKYMNSQFQGIFFVPGARSKHKDEEMSQLCNNNAEVVLQHLDLYFKKQKYNMLIFFKLPLEIIIHSNSL